MNVEMRVVIILDDIHIGHSPGILAHHRASSVISVDDIGGCMAPSGWRCRMISGVDVQLRRLPRVCPTTYTNVCTLHHLVTTKLENSCPASFKALTGRCWRRVKKKCVEWTKFFSSNGCPISTNNSALLCARVGKAMGSSGYPNQNTEACLILPLWYVRAVHYMQNAGDTQLSVRQSLQSHAKSTAGSRNWYLRLCRECYPFLFHH